MPFLTDTQNELDLLILEDYEFETACEGEMHPVSASGHNASQSATHFARCPECSATIMICAGRATYLRTVSRIICWECHERPLSEEWTIRRMPGK